MIKISELLKLSEELDISPRVYHNIDAPTLVSLAQQHGATRFSVNDQVHAGNARFFTHEQLAPYNPKKQVRVNGAVTHNRDTNQLSYEVVGNSDTKHPILGQLQGLGVKQGINILDNQKNIKWD